MLKETSSKNDLYILKEILYEYVFSKSYVRTFSMYILFATFASTCFDIHVGQVTKNLTEKITNSKDIGTSLLLYSIITIISISLIELNNLMFTSPVQHVYRLTARNSFKNFLHMDITQYSKIGCGEIQVIIDRESKAISELIEVIMLKIIPIVFLLTLAFASILVNIGIFNLIIIFLSLFIYIVSTIKIVHWRTKIRHDYNKSQQKCSNILHDSLINHETILACKTEEQESLKYKEYVTIVEHECNRLWRSLSILFLVNKLIFAAQYFFVIIFGGYGIFTPKLTAKDITYYLSINKSLYQSLGNLGFFYSRYTQAVMNVRTSLKLETTSEEFNVIDRHYLQKDISLIDVSYILNSKIILQNINFVIKKGEKVAIIGRNGVGKSSLINILMNFVPFQGSVLFDGCFVKNISNSSFRKLISYVPQSSFLFNESVNYNLSYNNTNIKHDKIVEIAKQANIDNSINRLEKKYDTNVGDKGKKLSGGERQKVLLLRAFLKKSSIYIFDEPTSALDQSAEFDILKFILTTNKDATIIIVLHNLDLLHLFDKILHIKDKNVEVVSNNDIKSNKISVL